MNILNQKEITFKDLERFFFEIGCKIAKGFLQEFLEQTDKQLTGCKMTNGRRAIRNIFNIQDFNSLTYR